jgi:S1-C subfamily serine protease
MVMAIGRTEQAGGIAKGAALMRACCWLTLSVVVLVMLPFGAAQAQRKQPAKEIAQGSFSPIVKQAAPAVVNVYVRSRVQEFASPFANDPFFRQFFGDQFGRPSERQQNSLGSGVIVHASGIVVTNTHVIKGGGQTEIRIALADKREFDAKVISQDEKTDIAILRIEGGDGTFPTLELEDSDSLEVGDRVLAIGNPFGVGQTVTQGIVSALARSEIGQSEAQVFIQTDAAINPGNSGGALVDMAGRVVGINTAIFSKSGGSVGIGFAIPSNMVRLYA